MPTTTPRPTRLTRLATATVAAVGISLGSVAVAVSGDGPGGSPDPSAGPPSSLEHLSQLHTGNAPTP